MNKLPHYKFADMSKWGMSELEQVREQLRNGLAEEIHKRDALKAEIMWLQTEIEKYQTG